MVKRRESVEHNDRFDLAPAFLLLTQCCSINPHIPPPSSPSCGTGQRLHSPLHPARSTTLPGEAASTWQKTPDLFVQDLRRGDEEAGEWWGQGQWLSVCSTSGTQTYTQTHVIQSVVIHHLCVLASKYFWMSETHWGGRRELKMGRRGKIDQETGEGPKGWQEYISVVFATGRTNVCRVGQEVIYYYKHCTV